MVEGRALNNVLRMWSHTETLLPLVAQFGATQFLSLQVSRRHRELIVLAVAHALESPYVWNKHETIATASGVTAREQDAVRLGADVPAADAPFGAADTALLDFARAVALGPKVSDDVFATMREHFTEREIVETISVVGYYFTIARMTTVLDIQDDDAPVV